MENDDLEQELPMSAVDADEESDDIIDDALSDLIDLVVPENDSEEYEDDIEEASDVLFDAIADLVDSKAIKEIPEDDATDEEKQEWLDASLEQVKTALMAAMDEALDGDSDS